MFRLLARCQTLTGAVILGSLVLPNASTAAGRSTTEYRLAISPVPTGGKVQSAGINCGAGATACETTMPGAMGLGLKATAASGFTFSGWSGDCSGTSRYFQLNLSGPRTCSAVFTPTVKTTPSLSWAAPAPVFQGTALGASQLNASASVPGSIAYSPSAGSPLEPGTHSRSVTFTPADAVSYNTAKASVTPVVKKKTIPVIRWAAPAAIVLGTPLSAMQLNATARVAGSFSYAPAAGTVLEAGTHALSVTFTPTDAVRYTTATKSVGLVVNPKSVPTISWAAPAAIVQGTALGVSQLNATSIVPGSFAYSPAAGTVLSVGTQTLSVTFTPTDTTLYARATKSVSLAVNSKAVPTITWAAPAAIVQGTALGVSQLNATSIVPGSFAYSPAAGTVLPVGTQTLSVTFTPTDTTLYTAATKSVVLTVRGIPTITWVEPAMLAQGVALSAAQLNATASVPGTFVYSPAAGTVLPAGTHALSVTFTPTDAALYTTATKSVSLTVNPKAVPTITWAAPAAIVQGTALSAAQLNATATVDGSFVYTPAAGTVLPEGIHTLSVAFTPADPTRYATANAAVSLTVQPAAPTGRPFISLSHYAQADRASTAYTRFKAAADAAVAGNPPYAYSAAHSVIMYRLSGDLSYLDDAIARVEAFVTAAETTIAAGGRPVIAYDSYLHVGTYLEQLALAYDYGYDRLLPSQRERWAAFAEQTLQNLWNPTTASWGGVPFPWSGWSLRDPGNNYHFSFLRATMLWGLAAPSPTWLTFLQTEKFPPLTSYYAQLPGGGSREGTGYGVAHKNLFETYLYWLDSTGENRADLTAHTRETIDYWVHATVPTLNRFAPIGDQSRSSIPTLYDYHENLVHVAAVLSPGTSQARRGTWWLQNNSVNGVYHAFNLADELLTFPDAPEAPTDLVHHATGVGALFARSSWQTDAAWLALVAGKFDQGHAHQDQGSFTFFRNDWLAVTSNIWSRSGIHQDVGVHNVLRFEREDGSVIPQSRSASLASTMTATSDSSSGLLTVTANLTNAYWRDQTAVQSWTRTFEFFDHTLRVTDTCLVAPGVRPVFQLHVPTQPVQLADGAVVAGNLTIIPLQGVTVTWTAMPTPEYSRGYRLDFTSTVGCSFSFELRAR